MRAIFTTACLAGVLVFTGVATATPITLGRTESRTDHVSVGVGGIGSGQGNLVVSGVSGNVRKAFLYWHGINNSGALAVYNNPTVQFAGNSVTGVSLGDAETNCWGAGSSRAFFADVTELVDGNGTYSISGLGAGAGHSGNGASLIVLFNDANSDNDRDLVFFEGNDSDFIQTGIPPGDATGWSATLPNINYAGGNVFAEIHVGDGQVFGDGSISFTGASTVSFPDTSFLWDGVSVPNAGFSRAGSDSLWDIHPFNITGAFGAPGVQTIDFTGMLTTGDCHSLVVMVLDLGAGSAPCGNGELNEGEECDPAGSGDLDCPGVQTCVNDCTCGCTSDFQCNDGSACTFDVCDLQTGACLYEPACPTGPNCTDTCDAASGACRTCGHPYGNYSCVANAVYVLQGSLELRPCELCTCDVNSSGTVTTTDALIILRGCVGLPSDLQCSISESTTTTTNP